MLHAFCWHLGLLYRAQNDSFPWVGRGQRRQEKVTIIRQKRRYVDTSPIPLEPMDPDA